jgi:hypothetical protein
VHLEPQLVAYLVDRALLLLGLPLELRIGVGIDGRLLFSERCGFPCLRDKHVIVAGAGVAKRERTCLALNLSLPLPLPLPPALSGGDACAACRARTSSSTVADSRLTDWSRESSWLRRSSTRCSSSSLLVLSVGVVVLWWLMALALGSLVGGDVGAKTFLTLFLLEPMR